MTPQPPIIKPTQSAAWLFKTPQREEITLVREDHPSFHEPRYYYRGPHLCGSFHAPNNHEAINLVRRTTQATTYDFLHEN